MATDNVRELREAREAQGLDPDRGGASISERAANGRVEASDQQGFFDREVEDNALERALTARQAKKERKAQAKKEFDTADAKAKALIEELALEVDEVVRVGRFKIRLGGVKGGTPVSFETSDRQQLYISEIKD